MVDSRKSYTTIFQNVVRELITQVDLNQGGAPKSTVKIALKSHFEVRMHRTQGCVFDYILKRIRHMNSIANKQCFIECLLKFNLDRKYFVINKNHVCMNTVLGTVLRRQKKLNKYRLNLNLESECLGSGYIINVTLKSTFNSHSDSAYGK